MNSIRSLLACAVALTVSFPGLALAQSAQPPTNAASSLIKGSQPTSLGDIARQQQAHSATPIKPTAPTGLGNLSSLRQDRRTTTATQPIKNERPPSLGNLASLRRDNGGTTTPIPNQRPPTLGNLSSLRHDQNTSTARSEAGAASVPGLSARPAR